jgi:hypothetical protein
MTKPTFRFLSSTIFLAFLTTTCTCETAAAARVETIIGYVVKQGKDFVIEADDGDYIVRGRNVSNMVNRLVEATGIITRSVKGDFIQVKSMTDIQDTEPD